MDLIVMCFDWSWRIYYHKQQQNGHHKMDYKNSKDNKELHQKLKHSVPEY